MLLQIQQVGTIGKSVSKMCLLFVKLMDVMNFIPYMISFFIHM